MVAQNIFFDIIAPFLFLLKIAAAIVGSHAVLKMYLKVFVFQLV